ncbi:MAG: 3-keto-5-aminohexanoate cleavage protein [Pseudomonadota bacterium]|nr:3-keto-5-aminohexanoate cleavage protein [Pseudomonadota bacterium]
MAAPNGARRTKQDHPAIPMTPAEIGEDAARCREAGAAMVHVHVRDRQGKHVLDADLYRQALGQIERIAGYNLIVQITTEAVGKYGAEEQMQLVRDVRPEAVSMALSEIFPVDLPEKRFAAFLEWMREDAIWPQFILYDANDLVRFIELKTRGLIPFRRPFVLFVLGKYSKGQEADPADLDSFLRANTDGDLVWSFCSFGKSVFKCVDAVLAHGGHVRIGMENNLHLRDGKPADSNADLVRECVRAANASGRRLLSPAALRQLKTDAYI